MTKRVRKATNAFKNANESMVNDLKRQMNSSERDSFRKNMAKIIDSQPDW
jgi:hypothetical protein